MNNDFALDFAGLKITSCHQCPKGKLLEQFAHAICPLQQITGDQSYVRHRTCRPLCNLLINQLSKHCHDERARDMSHSHSGCTLRVAEGLKKLGVAVCGNLDLSCFWCAHQVWRLILHSKATITIYLKFVSDAHPVHADDVITMSQDSQHLLLPSVCE